MKKNLIMLGIAAAVILILVCFTDIQSVDEYYLTHMEDITADSETVTISIVCDTVRQKENWDKLDEQLKNEKYVPRDGVILQETTYVLRPGDTAYDILNRVCRYNQIQMESVGASATAYGSVYIRGINYLYEHSCGPLSGWMFRINGDFPGVGCAAYELKDKDKIQWVYSCDLGRDVGDSYFENDKEITDSGGTLTGIDDKEGHR